MKLAAGLLIVLALVVGVVPAYTDCQSQGRALALANGNTVPMKCHWSGLAELSLAVPLGLVGVSTAFSKRKESRRMLAILGMALGALVIAVPTVLIGVCAQCGHDLQFGHAAHADPGGRAGDGDQPGLWDPERARARGPGMNFFRLSLKNIQGSSFRSGVVLLCALIVAALSLSILLVGRGAEDSLRLAYARMGADIVVVPQGAEFEVENALLMGEPARVWMPEENLSKIAAIPGVAAVSPQIYLSTDGGRALLRGAGDVRRGL